MRLFERFLVPILYDGLGYNVKNMQYNTECRGVRALNGIGTSMP